MRTLTPDLLFVSLPDIDLSPDEYNYWPERHLHACSECGALVQQTQQVQHARWHAHIAKAIA